MVLPNHTAGSSHRRRSSTLASQVQPSRTSPAPSAADGAYTHVREHSLRPEEPSPIPEADTDASDLSSLAESSAGSSHDGSDGDDEETGLTAKQRQRRRRRRKKRRRRLDAQVGIVGALKSRLSPDLGVALELLINAGFISLWYMFSLAISLYNKWMFSDDTVVFPYPLFSTSLHMLVQFTLSAILLYAFPSLRPWSKVPALRNASPSTTDPIMTRFFYLTRLVPCGTATSLDVGLGNMSLKYITLTFLTMCKSSSLGFVLLFAFLFGLEQPSWKLVFIIATLAVGVVMMAAGETAFNLVGFFLVIASAFFSGFRWALTQILLLHHPATSNPFSTLLFLTPVMFITLLGIALAVEGPAQISNGIITLADARGWFMGLFLLIVPGVLAFCMISAEFALLKRSSVVTLSVCGIFKEVVTITAAGIVFDDKLTAVNVTGLIVTIASISAYNYLKISMMRREARKNAQPPPSDEEYGILLLQPETVELDQQNHRRALSLSGADTRREYLSVPSDAPESSPLIREEEEEDVPNSNPTSNEAGR